MVLEKEMFKSWEAQQVVRFNIIPGNPLGPVKPLGPISPIIPWAPGGPSSPCMPSLPLSPFKYYLLISAHLLYLVND